MGEWALFTESSAGYAGIKAEAEFAFDARPLPYRESVGTSPQNTIIGGASLWVMEGHEPAEYKRAARFLANLSSQDVQAQRQQGTDYSPVTNAAAEAMRESGFQAENLGTERAVIQMATNEPTANSNGLRFGAFDQIRGIIDKEREAVWAGDKDAQTALYCAVMCGDQLPRRFDAAH